MKVARRGDRAFVYIYESDSRNKYADKRKAAEKYFDDSDILTGIRNGKCFDEICGGYDHTFVLSGKARLFSPVTGISMSCTTDMPGIQIYSGNFLQETGGDYGKNSGIAMETGFYPDTPNHPAFPQCTLRGGNTFRSVTEYEFGE